MRGVESIATHHSCSYYSYSWNVMSRGMWESSLAAIPHRHGDEVGVGKRNLRHLTMGKSTIADGCFHSYLSLSLSLAVLLHRVSPLPAN